jgi:hypothetical protein
MPYSNSMKPVALPPGSARLLTKPAPTGSGTIANTIGTVRVACSNGPTAAERDELPPPDHSITSSASESRLSEIEIPSALAVLMLMINSNFVAC